MASFPEVIDVVNQIGRTDDGTDTDGYYNSEYFVPLRPQKDWPAVVEQGGWRRDTAILSVPARYRRRRAENLAVAALRRSPRSKDDWSPPCRPNCRTSSPASSGTSRRTSATT